MLNKQQASKLSPLVNNQQAWVALEEHLQHLTEMTVQALMAAPLESELRQLQGKLRLLETLKGLKSEYMATQNLKDNNNGS
jgi:hypothetical protein